MLHIAFAAKNIADSRTEGITFFFNLKFPLSGFSYCSNLRTQPIGLNSINCTEPNQFDYMISFVICTKNWGRKIIYCKFRKTSRFPFEIESIGEVLRWDSQVKTQQTKQLTSQMKISPLTDTKGDWIPKDNIGLSDKGVFGILLQTFSRTAIQAHPKWPAL